LELKTALVTGGSRGIGKAIAKKLVQDGYNVVVAGTRNEGEVTEAINEIRGINGTVRYTQADIARACDREKILDTCLNFFGRIDVLVNNAGVAPKVRMDILETTEESLDGVLDINLKGTFFLTQLVAKAMVRDMEKGNIQNPKIINISSISAYTSSTNRPEYCISKAGVSMITSLFADRLAEYGVYVYEIRPGIIATDMTSKVKEKYDRLIEEGLTPIKRWGLPEDIANAVSSLCSGHFLFSTGEVFNVDGGFHLRRL
jgi:NAD(P)-dependent dehydrogenase (short-subunit alcohol dehydrogenase family)